MSSGSVGVAGFIGLRPGGRRVRLGSLCSVAPWMLSISFWSRWEHWCAPRGTSGLFGVAGFIGWGCLVRSGSLGLLGYALGVDGFVRDSWVH